MKDGLFIISKPLQLMIALCITEQYSWRNNPKFLIINGFNKNPNFETNIVKIYLGKIDFLFFEDQKTAYYYATKITACNLFIDSDIGLKKHLTLLKLRVFSKTKIHVYEEGVGTYRKDLYARSKKLLLKSVGAGVNFGSNALTSSIHVYSPEEYTHISPRNKNIIKIEKPLKAFIENEKSKLTKIFEHEPMDKNTKKSPFCLLYLSGWSIDPTVLAVLAKKEGDVYIKPHPHIRKIINPGKIRLLDGGTPAELIILELQKVYDQVFVYDYMSSCRRYIQSENLVYRLATTLI